MRRMVIPHAAIVAALALGTAAHAETGSLGAGPLIGGATAAAGYALPFDPARVPLAAPLGPLMAFGPSAPGNANATATVGDVDHDED